MTGVEPLVSFVVQTLGTFLIEEAQFLGAVSGKVEEMKTELTRMQCFLVDADRRRNGGDTSVSNLVIEIRELAYDAEEVMATFVVKIAGEAGFRRTPPLPVCFDFKRPFRFVKTSVTRYALGTQMQEINSKIVTLREGLQTYKVLEQTATATTTNPRMRYSTVVENNVVGLKDHVTILVAYLMDKTHSRVISIWGMGGLGKTTFVKEIYGHGAVKNYFDHVALVCVSQECNPNQVWREILLQFFDSEEQKKRIRKLTPSELVRELESLQMQKKCLVILDDIWEQKDWSTLNDAFPRATSTGSKIMLTTRNQVVVSHDDIQCFPYRLPLLEKEECLELLEVKLSRNRQAPDVKMCTEKKKVLVEIVKHCGGLPLAIVLVSGLLVEDSSLGGCEKVRQDLRNSLNKGNSRNEGVWDVLALSYQELPYHLKACFLYLSLFPEDHDIIAKELVQMWIAEGFVSAAATTGGEGTNLTTMLDVGLSYLNELVNRCIVQAGFITKCGKRVRSCRLHDLMRDFCLSMAREENFSTEFDPQQSACSSSPNRIRRLAVHSKQVTPIPHGKQYQHVRSCLVSRSHQCGWDGINSLLRSFKFLKVFNCSGYSEDTSKVELSEDIGKLVHLRYLRVVNCKRLPSSLGSLILLQTLDLQSAGYLCDIPDILWKLKELRHLYLPNRLNITKRLRVGGLSKLETLTGFDTKRSDVGDLMTLTNLRKLHIECEVIELAKILESPMFSESNSHLRRCNFVINGDTKTQEDHIALCQVSACTRVTKLSLNGLVYEETFLHNLSTKMTTLTLFGCGLKEDPMPALRMMPNLRKLSLLRGSYTGEKMGCLAPKSTTKETTNTSTQVSFPQLTYLWLEGLEISEWKLEHGALPCLSRLTILSCKKLNEIPDALRFIATLQTVRIIQPPESLKQRLREGGEDWLKIQHAPVVTIKDRVFRVGQKKYYLDGDTTLAVLN